jgi:hypothetical protein
MTGTLGGMIHDDGDGGEPRWALLEAARERIAARLAGRGVQRVEFVAPLGSSAEVWVWLGTATDEARDALGEPDPCVGEVRQELAAAGYPGHQLEHVHTAAQSQETVDRDYASSWFYALR